MSSRISFGNPLAAGATPTSSAPFHVLALGDFGVRGLEDAPARRRPIEFDRDNLEELMDRFEVGVRLQLDPGSPPVEIRFSEVDDFHPDSLYERLELFEALRTTRRRLQNAKSFDATAAEIQAAAQGHSAGDDEDTTSPDASDVAGLFEQTLEQTTARGKTLEQRISEGDVDWNQYAREIVEPFVVAKTDPRQAEFIAGVDEAISQSMRRLLHHPEFQRIESAWRGMHFMSRRIETDVRLRLFLMDVSKSELADDLRAGDDLQESDVYRVLVDEVFGKPGTPSWSLILADYTFDDSDEDVETLGRLSRVLAAAGAPMISGGSSQITGRTDLGAADDDEDARSLDRETEWRSLRDLPESRFVALAQPRILMRTPYGDRSSPIEAFTFEEIAPPAPHEDFLWGNPAFGIGTLLAQAFSRSGWGLRSAMSPELEDLPVHVFDEDGESRMTPCAEVILDPSVAEAVASRGLVPLYSLPQRDAVQIPRLFSLSAADSSLAGPWDSAAGG